MMIASTTYHRHRALAADMRKQIAAGGQHLLALPMTLDGVLARLVTLKTETNGYTDGPDANRAAFRTSPRANLTAGTTVGVTVD